MTKHIFKLVSAPPSFRSINAQFPCPDFKIPIRFPSTQNFLPRFKIPNRQRQNVVPFKWRDEVFSRRPPEPEVVVNPDMTQRP